MCGICGVFYKDNQKVDKAFLKSMNDKIKHRGPDDYGYYTDNSIGLGHRRLSIIDLSKKGKQPMTNEDGTVWITFNGEIYNYKTIKEELEKRKLKFKSNTDTEVIIHGYEEWGEKIVSMIDGMFAFAIWDSNKKTMFIARDRFGKKPLYYYNDKKKFLFASEIKSIISDEEIKREVDQQALSDFLGLGYVPPPATMFKAVKKLPQSHHMTLNKEGMKVERYYGIKIKNKVKGDRKIVTKLFRDAIEKRLMSDVPLGAFLSGGVDSSAIVAMMSMINKEPVKTFSVGFNHPTDELKYANMIAKKFNTEHKEIIVNYDTLKILPKVVWHLDEPLADPAVLPTYIMSKETKRYISVVLCGEGGDEVFLGYKRYKQMMLLRNIRKIPLPGNRKMLPAIARSMGSMINHENRKYLDFSSEILPIINDDVKVYGKLHHFAFEGEEKKAIMKYGNKIDFTREYKLIKQNFEGKKTIFDKMTAFDFNVWLTDDILMKVDKTTMASALEARAPFLDTRLVEYAVNLMPESRMEKRIFKETLKGTIPETILQRKKHGFNVPVASWFDKKEMRNMATDMFNYLEKEKVFNKTAMESILRTYKKYRYDQQLWNLLTFGHWYQLFIEN
jgi:asparagine synthase (glutamine-hydrolysing)